ncbi:MAG TPA: diol dehydratase reactivase ATPase-like domain-containing protein [Trebonia sp.]
MTVAAIVAGVDIGNATTEIVIVRRGAAGPGFPGSQILAAGRAPTRGHKASPQSLHGAAALLRRVERQAGAAVTEARIAAPLRPVDTFVRIVADVPPATGRLRALAAGVATPGGAGACVGVPRLLPAQQSAPAAGAGAGAAAGARAADAPVVVLVPPGLHYDEAAARIGTLIASGARVGAVLTAGDEGVLIANRLPVNARVPVIDQVDIQAASACSLLAVEVRPPGHALTTLSDPVALSAAFGLDQGEAADAATLSRTLLDYSNAVVGLMPTVSPSAVAPPLAPATHALPGGDPVDDVFTVDLAAVAEAATARRGRLGRAILVAALRKESPAEGTAAEALSALLGIPVTSPLTEPAAARLGASTTPGMLPGALVADFGAGTVDVITPDGEAVVAGAGDLLTAAVAETLGVSRAAADWIKRGPSIRLDGTARYEAEDGTRGFLDTPAPTSAAGMLAVPGPGGLLPFGAGPAGNMAPGEWRALRHRLKQATLSASLQRALSALDWRPAGPAQLLLVGGPVGDDELAGVVSRSLPENVIIGRANIGATLAGESLAHRHAAALGLALG